MQGNSAFAQNSFFYWFCCSWMLVPVATTATDPKMGVSSKIYSLFTQDHISKTLLPPIRLFVFLFDFVPIPIVPNSQLFLLFLSFFLFHFAELTTHPPLGHGHCPAQIPFRVVDHLLMDRRLQNPHEHRECFVLVSIWGPHTSVFETPGMYIETLSFILISLSFLSHMFHSWT